MRKKTVLLSVSVILFTLLLVVGILCWIAYANQPTFLDLTRKELETFDLYVDDKLITNEAVREKFISGCLKMEPFRPRISFFDTVIGDTSVCKSFQFRKGDTRYAVLFKWAEEQLDVHYVHRDHPIVIVTKLSDETVQMFPHTEGTRTSVEEDWYYTLSPEVYSTLLYLTWNPTEYWNFDG